MDQDYPIQQVGEYPVSESRPAEGETPSLGRNRKRVFLRALEPALQEMEKAQGSIAHQMYEEDEPRYNKSFSGTRNDYLRRLTALANSLIDTHPEGLTREDIQLYTRERTNLKSGHTDDLLRDMIDQAIHFDEGVLLGAFDIAVKTPHAVVKGPIAPDPKIRKKQPIIYS